MKYGIHPLVGNHIEGAHKWLFDTEKEAVDTAQELCEKYHVEIIVFEILGTFKQKVDYERSCYGNPTYYPQDGAVTT